MFVLRYPLVVATDKAQSGSMLMSLVLKVSLFAHPDYNTQSFQTNMVLVLENTSIVWTGGENLKKFRVEC